MPRVPSSNGLPLEWPRAPSWSRFGGEAHLQQTALREGTLHRRPR
jgi:hypothetical protein